jgi:hypothetical protein
MYAAGDCGNTRLFHPPATIDRPAMTRFSLNLLAKLLAAVLLVIAIRTLGEVFLLEYVRGEFPSYGEARPFLLGALTASLALAVTLLAIWAGRPSPAIVLACLAIAGLFIYRVYFWPPSVETSPAPPASTTATPPA